MSKSASSRTEKYYLEQDKGSFMEIKWFCHPLRPSILQTQSSISGLIFTWRSLPYSFLYSQFTHITFIYLQSVIHHFMGLFGTNIMNSSQLACQLSWSSAAPVSLRSLVQIPYRPEYFQALFSPLLTWWS